MKIISIINMKGGCAKTVSSISIAHILAAKHGARVLLVDMDKQGNTSKFFGLYGYEAASIADVLTQKGYDAAAAVQETAYERLHVIPANMRLLLANRDILLDVSRPQQTRLKRALDALGGAYDYCIIDCAPDINMGTINALVASDAVLVPISIDKFDFDGIGELIDQVDDLTEFNPALHIAGCFITMYRRDGVNAGGLAWLRENAPIPVFDTVIRATVRVSETTYTGVPIAAHAPKSTAAMDYVALVDELLLGVYGGGRGAKGTV
ncbi:MAG: ParA family protein [Clostridia bacterium]|nr:ParA family protein [Clostridia bacterium]